MNTYDSEKGLEKIQDFQKIAGIATVVFGLAVIIFCVLLSVPKIGDILFRVPYWILMIIWIIVLGIPLIPSALLVVSPDIRKLHFAVRLNLAFRYIFYSWIVFFSGILLYEATTGMTGLLAVVIPMSVTGIILGFLYLILHRKYAKKAETMFP